MHSQRNTPSLPHLEWMWNEIEWVNEWMKEWIQKQNQEQKHREEKKLVWWIFGNRKWTTVRHLTVDFNNNIELWKLKNNVIKDL